MGPTPERSTLSERFFLTTNDVNLGYVALEALERSKVSIVEVIPF